MSGDEDESRSERLRRRRQQSSESAQSTQPVEPSEQSETSKPSKTSNTQTVKDEQVGTYMYLPQSQKRDLDRLYNVCKAEYEFEYDDEFEKNRHFFPLVIQYGLDGLDGLDASEIKDRLDGL